MPRMLVIPGPAKPEPGTQEHGRWEDCIGGSTERSVAGVHGFRARTCGAPRNDARSRRTGTMLMSEEAQ